MKKRLRPARQTSTTGRQLQRKTQVRPCRRQPFIKLEKNLASLGFFTPSSKAIKDAKEKTVTFNRTVDGKRVEAKANIVPSAKYGLPVTSDQDKYFALQKIITELRQHNGQVKNPVTFTTSQLLRILGSRVKAGKNYDDVAESLKRISATTIESEGVVYFAGKKAWATDIFHVFDRLVMYGAELAPGKIADKNYLWLSEWQLENINNDFLFPVDFQTYRQLKNHIAKALVPLLQVWLFASREDGYFEKRYNELCQILNIRQYPYLSLIKQTLAPSLNELKDHGYLADWRIEKTADRKSFKVVFAHGEKFFTDHQLHSGKEQKKLQPPKGADVSKQEINHQLLSMLVDREVMEDKARDLLSQAPQRKRDIWYQIRHWDELRSRNPDKYGTGLLCSFISQNRPVPKAARGRIDLQEGEQIERERTEEQMRLNESLRMEHEEYLEREIDNYLDTLGKDEYKRLLGQKEKELRRSRMMKHSPPEEITRTAHRAVRKQIFQSLPVLSWTEFQKQKREELG